MQQKLLESLFLFILTIFSILDSLQEELCGVEALHIIPASCSQSLAHIRDYILVVDISSVDSDLRNSKNVLLKHKSRRNNGIT